MKISVVTFNDSLLIGKALEPIRSLSVGQRIDGGTVSIEKYDNLFLKISYAHTSAPARDYSELIPFARVDKLIFTESNDKPQSASKASRGATA